jgi:hypothetical protein
MPVGSIWLKSGRIDAATGSINVHNYAEYQSPEEEIIYKLHNRKII